MKLMLILVLVASQISGCSRTSFKSLNPHEKIEADISDLKKRVEILESQYAANAEVVNALSAQVDALAAMINALQAADLTFTEQDNALQASLAAMQASLNALQLAQNEVVADLAELQTHESIVEFVDPCGNGPGFDEVLLRTTSGKLVAYFESSGNRFLSILSAGNYRTTDGQGCYFTVNSSGQIVNEHL